MRKDKAKQGEINIGIDSKDREAITRGLPHLLAATCTLFDVHEKTARKWRALQEE